MLGAGDERGIAAPQFAVPGRAGSLEGDANVYQDDCESSELPCPAEERADAGVRDDRARPRTALIRVCDLFDRPLVISFWFSRGGDCLPTQDLVDRAASRYRGRVNFLSVDVRDDREEVRDVIAERGWELPGRLRPRRRRKQHLPGGRLPDRRLRVSRRDHPFRQRRQRGA